LKLVDPSAIASGLPVFFSDLLFCFSSFLHFLLHLFFRQRVC
jgi:hypothetical protein